ncbi:MAG: ShlB/FhaC/HecB family hemolysin secretion/activation protein [Aphanothece sp. CMT-3BRIN-NPC111]|jgi:hemolysin activation/secretion protein|nr:ShlB/FhaC/HecB family hemolysin secretion/activation protein [Aphanothece sp. CMT-3BRIN-NPC111]
MLSSTIAVSPLKAQTTVPLPPPISPTPPPLPSPEDLLKPSPTPLPLPSPQDLLTPSPQTPTNPEVPANTAPGTITVERFDVVGSTVFSKRKLDQVLAPFTKRPLSFAELLQARSAVTKLYNDEGYITTGAYIPPQPFQDGVVRIEVVEGTLEGINVTGTKRLNRNYVRSRIANATSKPLNVPRLLEALRLLQLNPLIKNVSAELSAGSRTGQNLLDVRVAEADTFSSPIILNNARSPSVGTFQRGVQINEANLLGLGDSISFAYKNTEGSNTYDASYILPINSANGTLGLSYSNASSNVIEAPFNLIDIEAASRYYDITLHQPIIQTPSKELALGLRASRRESNTSLLGIPFPLSPGADEQGRTRISALRFFQDFTQRGNRQVFSARSEVSLGLDILNSTINKTAPDSRFLAWRGQVQLARLLAPETLLLLRGDVQLASRALVPLEQFSLGGQESVRGYRQDALLTDNGAFASAEVRLPIYRTARQQGVLQLIPFVDVGTTWNSSGQDAPDPNTLASIGLGLQWQQGDRFKARLDYGIPLISISSSDRTWQENGLYFSVIYNPF